MINNNKLMKIIAGSASEELSKNLSLITDTHILQTNLKRFHDGEIFVEIQEKIENDTVCIVQSTASPVHDNLIELLLLVDAAKRSGASRIIAIIPYFGYSRQDRQMSCSSSIGVSVIAKILSNSYIDEIITFDFHSVQLAGFFDINAININPDQMVLKVLSKYYSEINCKDIVLISPDIGGAKNLKNIAYQSNHPISIVDKHRVHDVCMATNLLGADVRNKHCIIIDDILDTGNTLCAAIKLLYDNGAKIVDAYISHAILSNNAVQLIQNTNINKIYYTDTIEHKVKLPSNFVKLFIGNLLAKYIR
ncbi:MAG: ribose-phosphate diphosphokinase [Rickettsiaceae bacterium]